jgi:hypothetical protein
MSPRAGVTANGCASTIVREIETLGDWDGAARRFTARPAGPGQGQVILLQSPDLRILGAADLPAV